MGQWGNVKEPLPHCLIASFRDSINERVYDARALTTARALRIL